MNKILLIILFFMSWAAAKAQDKIITIRRDTIECRIVSINGDRISYEQKTPDNLFVGKSISTLEVLRYFRAEKLNREDNYLDDVKVRRERPENPWLFSLQGGLSQSFTDYDKLHDNMILSGSTVASVDDYFSKLENGYHLNASFHYFISSSFGIGVDYNLFYAASKGEFLAHGYGTLNIPSFSKYEADERIYSQFTGASVLFQQYFDKNKKIKISESISPGIVQFRHERRYIVYQPYRGYGYGYGYGGYGYGGPSYYQPFNSLLTSTPFGVKGSLAIDYALTSHLSAGIAGDYMWAKVHKLSARSQIGVYKDQKQEEPINISHLDYGFVVRYNF